MEIAQREIAQPSNFPIVWVVDEFSTIMRNSQWADVASQLATAIEDYAQCGRKRNRTAIVLGQVAKSTRTGGTELRSSMTATFVHRLPAQQARMVIDSDTAAAVPTLAIGEVMVQLQNAAEPYRMTIPETALDDMHTVKALILQHSSSILTPFSRHSDSVLEQDENTARNTMNAPENEVERVQALYLAGLPKPSKRAIIMEVWGVRPGGSLAWQEASRKYDSIVAEIEQHEKEEA